MCPQRENELGAKHCGSPQGELLDYGGSSKGNFSPFPEGLKLSSANKNGELRWGRDTSHSRSLSRQYVLYRATGDLVPAGSPSDTQRGFSKMLALFESVRDWGSSPWGLVTIGRRVSLRSAGCRFRLGEIPTLPLGDFFTEIALSRITTIRLTGFARSSQSCIEQPHQLAERP